MVATAETVTLDDALWERITRITGGLTWPCYQCGACTAVCPWGRVREDATNVRRLIRHLQVGNSADTEIWLCTACRQCQEQCPRGVDVPAVFRSLRRAAWQERAVPAGMPSLLWHLFWDGNPGGQPPSQRFAWARDLDLPPYAPDHEILLYVGCSASYDRRLQRVARALVAVLRAAKVSFGVLGDEEPCCGEAAFAVGQDAFVRRIVERNVALFRARGVRRLVALSPHCYDMFRNRHPVGGEFEPLHYTQLLDDLLQAGRLPLGEIEPLALTFHDPCLLGRAHGVYAPPRRVLAAIGGAELYEMADNREAALCCGGGGGRMWVETPASERFAVLRAREAQATGAAVLATACPACLSCLEDGLKVIGAAEMRVLDIAEVVAMALPPPAEPVDRGETP